MATIKEILEDLLALLYRDANDLVDPPAVDVPPPADIQRPILNIYTPNGNVSVPGRTVIELNNFLQELMNIGYNPVSIEELCNHPARMLFRNLLGEEELFVANHMRPLRKEIDRIFYRLITESPNEDEAFGFLNVRKFDMPYRSITFVRTLWTTLGLVYEDEDNMNMALYWEHLVEQEGRNVQLELQFGLNEQQHGLAFPAIIEERRIQREGD